MDGNQLTRWNPPFAVRLENHLVAANPKVLLLTAAAGLTVGSEQAGFGPSAVAVLVFTVIASITVALPVVLFAIFGEDLGPLGKVRSWLERHNAIVMAVVIWQSGIGKEGSVACDSYQIRGSG